MAVRKLGCAWKVFSLYSIGRQQALTAREARRIARHRRSGVGCGGDRLWGVRARMGTSCVRRFRRIWRRSSIGKRRKGKM